MSCPTLYHPPAMIPSPSRPRHNLPVQRLPLVGRDDDLAAVVTLLQRPEVGLLTLTGAGGTGKTRLALAVAAEVAGNYRDGVWFVPLAALTDPELVLPAIAQTLGVREREGQTLQACLVEHLQDQVLLLVLDNVEHLLGAAPLVAELLAAAPGLTVLATSRAPLRVRDEQVYPVAPLALPPDYALSPAKAVAASPAVDLFCQRAVALRPDFALTPENVADVVAICRRLDSLPLALELAAARIKVIPPAALSAGLDGRTMMLTGGPRDLPLRQQTLRNTIGWSYDLLAATEQRVFRQFGVFVDGCTLEAIEAVCAVDGEHQTALDVVTTLIDHSLLKRISGPDGGVRIRMLGTIREFALEQLLTSGELEETRRRHAMYYMDLAQRSRSNVFGSHGPDNGAMLSQQHPSVDAVHAWMADDAVRLDMIAGEHGNFGAAIDWAGTHGTREMELGLVGALWPHWWRRGYVREGIQRFDAALSRSGPVSAPAVVEALHVSLTQLIVAGHHDRARQHVVRALDLATELGDPFRTRRLQALQCSVEWLSGNNDRTVELLEETLREARAAKDTWVEAQALCGLGMVCGTSGDLHRAIQLELESHRLIQSMGDLFAEPYVLTPLAKLWLDCGAIEQADKSAKDAIQRFAGTVEPWGLATSLVTLTGIALRREDAAQAARLLGAAEALLDEMGGVLFPPWQADKHRFTHEAHAALGDAAFTTAWTEGRETPFYDVTRRGTDSLDVSVSPDCLPPDANPGYLPSVALTPRELEIVTLIAAGQSNREIAETLVLSARTVERHIENIYAKLGVHGQAARAAVAAHAVRSGLLPVE